MSTILDVAKLMFKELKREKYPASVSHEIQNKVSVRTEIFVGA